MKRLALGNVIALFVSAFLVSVMLAGTALAQSGRSTVRGTIKDPQENVVAGANVTLSNANKNFTRTQTTTENGNYVFSAVPPDTYKVEVEAVGFKKVSISNVTALVDTPLDVNVQLEVGAVTETVTITSGI